jgi:hypothetical protein
MLYKFVDKQLQVTGFIVMPRLKTCQFLSLLQTRFFIYAIINNSIKQTKKMYKRLFLQDVRLQ